MKSQYSKPTLKIKTFDISMEVTLSKATNGVTLTENAMNEKNITNVQTTSLKDFNLIK